MSASLDTQAERLSGIYRQKRLGHKRSRALWLKLRDVRKRAVAASNRRARAIAELPLFAKARS